MKKRLLTFLTIFNCCLLWAQNENTSLILQSTDGKAVKLMWFFKSWPQDVTGFDIKSKAGNEDWVTLNSTPVLQSVSAQKDLTNVAGTAEVARLKTRLTGLISENKMHEISNDDFLQKLKSDPGAVQSIATMIALDYDYALLSGFGFIDESKKEKKTYTYGLFNHADHTLLAQATWKYGDEPDLDLVNETAVKQTARKNKVELVWTVANGKLQPGYVAGFNIYHNDKKLNDGPVMAAKKTDKSEFSFFDSLAANESMVRYYVKPVTIFGIEGKGKELKYNPASHPDELISPVIDTIITAGIQNGFSIKLQWKFPSDQEKFISGFYVEKSGLPGTYQQVSSVLPGNNREYEDKTPSSIATYIKMRVNVVYHSGDTVYGNEKLFYYAPAIAPPKPLHLTAKTEVTPDKKCIVHLAWDAATDSVTDFFQLYSSDPLSHKFFLEGSIPPIKTNHYDYKLDYQLSSGYKFCVSAMGKTLTESALSDTAFVISPSMELPIPVIASVKQDSNHVIIKWNYPDVFDIKSFRVFQNNNMVVSEFEYGKNFHEFKTPALKWNTNYNFTIQAVSESGVISLVSTPAAITVYKKPAQ